MERQTALRARLLRKAGYSAHLADVSASVHNVAVHHGGRTERVIRPPKLAHLGSKFQPEPRAEVSSIFNDVLDARTESYPSFVGEAALARRNEFVSLMVSDVTRDEIRAAMREGVDVPTAIRDRRVEREARLRALQARSAPKTSRVHCRPLPSVHGDASAVKVRAGQADAEVRLSLAKSDVLLAPDPTLTAACISGGPADEAVVAVGNITKHGDVTQSIMQSNRQFMRHCFAEPWSSDSETDSMSDEVGGSDSDDSGSDIDSVDAHTAISTADTTTMTHSDMISHTHDDSTMLSSLASGSVEVTESMSVHTVDTDVTKTRTPVRKPKKIKSINMADLQLALLKRPLEQRRRMLVQSPGQWMRWHAGDTALIAWTCYHPRVNRVSIQNAIGDTVILVMRVVTLQLYSRTTMVCLIASNVSNCGVFNWIIPTSLPEDDHYRVLVTATSPQAPQLNGWSPSYFSIARQRATVDTFTDLAPLMERAAKSVETRSQQEKAKQKALVLQTVIMKQKPDDDARQAAIRFALECHEHRAPIFRELYAPSDQSETVISFEQQYRATKLAQLPHAQQHSLPTTIKFLGTEVEPFQNGK